MKLSDLALRVLRAARISGGAAGLLAPSLVAFTAAGIAAGWCLYSFDATGVFRAFLWLVVVTSAWFVSQVLSHVIQLRRRNASEPKVPEGLELRCHVLSPSDPSSPDSRTPMPDLPPTLAGYVRQPESLLVEAVRSADDLVVGMGGGWVLAHPEQPLAIWVRAAEVNDPVLHAGLAEAMIQALLVCARRRGITRFHYDDGL